MTTPRDGCEMETWPMNAVYFDTTHLPTAELAQATAMAEEQNVRVLRIMREAGRPLTAWECWERGKVGGRDEWWLIGSVRRAMTSLTYGPTPSLVNLGSKRRSIDGRWQEDEICSWETLTECAKCGIEIDYNTRGSFFKTWEAHALPRKPKPPTVRKSSDER